MLLDRKYGSLCLMMGVQRLSNTTGEKTKPCFTVPDGEAMETIAADKPPKVSVVIPASITATLIANA